MNAYRSMQLVKWERLLSQIFSDAIPNYCEWRESSHTIHVLNQIGSSDADNHTFFPRSGGLDLCGVTMAHEEGCLETDFDGTRQILKPKKLVFQAFPGAAYEWAYFRIVTDRLNPTGVYPNLDPDYEFEGLVELSPLLYVERSAWDICEYGGQPLPRTARVVTRILKGDFVIFPKASIYNRNSATYDGRHDRLGEEGFRWHISKVIQMLEGVQGPD